MKKLTLTLGAIVVGLMANAANYSWGCSSLFFDGTGENSPMADGTTVYLMFASAYSQSALVSDFAGSGIKTSAAIASQDISSGRIGEGTASFTTTSDESAYLAIVYGKRLFISSEATAYYMTVGSGDIAFSSQAYLTRYNNTSKTLLPDNLASDGYSGAGWYNVPEPTSGLLLLLGVAGLALKRKVA